MKQRDPNRDHDELTQLLRDSDPAGDGSELSPAEIARLRRAVVETSRESGPAWLAVPALAVVTILTLAIAAWLLPRPGGDPGPVGPVETVIDPGPGGMEARAETDVESTMPDNAVAVAVGPPPSVPLAVAPPEVTPVSERAQPAEEVSSRTVRFTTPNGTRIVWVLNPNLDI